MSLSPAPRPTPRIGLPSNADLGASALRRLGPPLRFRLMGLVALACCWGLLSAACSSDPAPGEPGGACLEGDLCAYGFPCVDGICEADESITYDVAAGLDALSTIEPSTGGTGGDDPDAGGPADDDAAADEGDAASGDDAAQPAGGDDAVAAEDLADGGAAADDDAGASAE